MGAFLAGSCVESHPPRVRVVTIRCRGSFFGEVAILGDGRRSATVTATADSRVLAMLGTEFRRLEAEQPAIADSIADAMRRRVGAREAQAR